MFYASLFNSAFSAEGKMSDSCCGDLDWTNEDQTKEHHSGCPDKGCQLEGQLREKGWLDFDDSQNSYPIGQALRQAKPGDAIYINPRGGAFLSSIGEFPPPEKTFLQTLQSAHDLTTDLEQILNDSLSKASSKFERKTIMKVLGGLGKLEYQIFALMNLEEEN